MSLKLTRYHPGSFCDLYRDYVAAIDWLSNQVKINLQCRLETYKKLLRILDINHSRPPVLTAKLRDLHIRSAFLEAHEIIEVCNTFKHAGMPIPGNLLRNLAKGPPNYPDLIQGDPSREAFFELFIASRLLQNKIGINLGELKSDVSTEYLGFKTYIECKRLASETQFVKRIKEGLGQLDNRYSRNEREAGLIFLSIDQVINPELRLIKMGNRTELANYVNAAFQKYAGSGYLGKITSQFSKMPQQKTLAFLMRLSFPYVLTDTMSPGYGTYYYYSSFFTTTESSHFRFFEQMESKFLAQPFSNSN